MFLLNQAVNVCRWVHQFDPENINGEDLVLPPELRSLQDHAKVLVMEFPKMDLVAENSLRKFRPSAGISTVITQSKDSISFLSQSNSPLQTHKNQNELPTQQLEKFLTMTLGLPSRGGGTGVHVQGRA